MVTSDTCTIVIFQIKLVKRLFGIGTDGVGQIALSGGVFGDGIFEGEITAINFVSTDITVGKQLRTGFIGHNDAVVSELGNVGNLLGAQGNSDIAVNGQGTQRAAQDTGEIQCVGTIAIFDAQLGTIGGNNAVNVGQLIFIKGCHCIGIENHVLDIGQGTAGQVIGTGNAHGVDTVTAFDGGISTKVTITNDEDIIA